MARIKYAADPTSDNDGSLWINALPGFGVLPYSIHGAPGPVITVDYTFTAD
jgi:hypothetical protein